MKQLLGIVTLVYIALCSPSAAQETDSVRWLDSLPQATKLATATGKPIFIVFR